MENANALPENESDEDLDLQQLDKGRTVLKTGIEKDPNIIQNFCYAKEEESMNSKGIDQQKNLGTELEDPIHYDAYARMQTDLSNMNKLYVKLT